MNTLRTTPQLCPTCGYTLDAHTNTTGRGGPGPGDFTICISCSGILRYNEGLKCEAITLEEVRKSAAAKSRRSSTQSER